MPRTFICLSTLISLIFLAIHVKPVFAVDQNNFEVEQIPQPFSINKSDISITVKTKDGSNYFRENMYSFAAWKGTLAKNDSCTFTNFAGVASSPLTKDVDQTKITATWKIIAGTCGFSGDQWHFRLWRGTGWSTMENNPDNIIKDYSFAITPSSGQFITITAKNPDVYIGEKPIVILSNIEPNKDYTFWWKDEWKDVAGYYSRDKNPNNPLEVIIPYFSVDKQIRRLCMEYGNFRFPPGGNNSCNIEGKFVDFTFKNKDRPAPTDSIKCTILPSTSLPLNSIANIKIENVPTGSNVFAYAIDDSGNQWSTSHDVSDSTYSVTLTLVNQATAGSYSVAAYTDTDPGTNICASSLPNTAFTVSTNPAPISTASVCNPKTNPNCTSGGGKDVPGCNIPVDPNNPNDPAFTNPGIPTAIGCIHTNPAEFTKDLLTFLLGIGGGLAFLMMLLGAFQMLTSAGNPETLNAGKERLTSAIIGLLFIIFTILLLQIIGVGILNLPGFKP